VYSKKKLQVPTN
jgi:PADRE domain